MLELKTVFAWLGQNYNINILMAVHFFWKEHVINVPSLGGSGL